VDVGEIELAPSNILRSDENYNKIDVDAEDDQNDLNFGPRDPKILQVGVGLKLRDIDVEFKAGQFAYAFLWHAIWFLALGPLTTIPLSITERSFVLSKNMAFHPTVQLLPVYLF
jgi:hypothetical protein